LLKYHTMALDKRKKLWWEYPLKWVPAAEDKDIQKVKEILKEYIDEDFIA
jgi:pyruvate-formate lyase-activating enzyme